MPRTKTTTAKAAVKKPRVGAKVEKKAITKTIHPKKKAKSVLVDVIEDEPIIEPEWPAYKDEGAEAAVEDAGEAADIEDEVVMADGEEAGELVEEGGEIDNQKKYFADLANEIQGVKKEDNGKAGRADGVSVQKRSVGLYRHLVIKFVIIVAILAAAVFYFSFSKLTVTLNLRGENISDSMLLKVTDSSLATATTTSAFALANDPREQIGGTIKEINASVSRSYPATGETYLGEGIVGQVTIINNSVKSQPLVATTRLLSPDNKLFRIKNAVNVPAGGEVVVDIYSDSPTADMAIEPTTFTIPGLWLGLQDKIYAKSNIPFIFSKQVSKYITSGDIANASKDVNDALTEEAKRQAEVSGAALGGDWLYLPSGPVTVNVDSKIGDKKDEFTASASGKVVAVYFSKAEAAKLAATKLNLVIPDDKELSEFKAEDIAYSFDNYDPISGSATIKASFNGSMILKRDSEVISAAQLVNLNASQIDAYLKSHAEVKDYQLEFSPSFIKKAPSLVDRIKVQVRIE